MPTKEEKAEEIHASRCRNKSLFHEKEQQNPKVQISLTHSWLPRGSAQLPAEWVTADLSSHTAQMGFRKETSGDLDQTASAEVQGISLGLVIA